MAFSLGDGFLFVPIIAAALFMGVMMFVSIEDATKTRKPPRP